MRNVISVALLAFLMAPPAYAANSSSREIRDQLGEFMGIFLTVPNRRHAKERVVVRGNQRSGYIADIWHWRSLSKRNSAEEKCHAYTWLLAGRGLYGKGAGEAFDRFPGLKEINLRFFDVQTGTKLGKKKGEVLPTEKIIPYARVGVSKRSFQRKKTSEEQLEKSLQGRRCSSVGAKYVDKNWFNNAYLGSRK